MVVSFVVVVSVSMTAKTQSVDQHYIPSSKTIPIWQDFTFGLTIDDEEDGIMGTIVVPADSQTNIDDGDLLCIVLHRGDPDETTSKQDGNANSE